MNKLNILKPLLIILLLGFAFKGGGTMIFGRRFIVSQSVPTLYVKDGLVFDLRCTDLDLTNKKWIDRVGKNVFNLTDITQNLDNSVAFNGSSSICICNNLLNYQFDSITIECVCKNSGNGIIISNGNNNFVLIQNWFLQFGNNSSYVSTSMASNNNVLHILSLSKNIINLDGAPTTIEKYHTTVPDTNKLIIGGTDMSPWYYLKGNIYAIRIYNRLLTEDEMKYNYNIDLRLYEIL